MNALLDRVEERIRIDKMVQHGGVIVNGGSWYSEDSSRPLLKELMDRLQFDLVLILQDSQIKVESRVFHRDIVGNRRDVSLAERENVPSGRFVELARAGRAGVQHGDRFLFLRSRCEELLPRESQPVNAANGRIDDRFVR